MKVEALGPLLVAGERMRPRERALVAVLAVRRGRVVGVEEVADALWDGDLPPTWRKQVQIAVGRVRKLTGPDRIETTGTGYVLWLADAELDSAHFETLVGQASRYAAVGEHARAVAALEDAFALWRGEPYGDVAGWAPGADEAARLAEVRRGAEEDLLRARLAGGWHRSVVADAESLVRADPAREERWAMLATALYRSGRQRDALAALREARARLRDELGLDPGRGLADLETAILTQDGALEAPIEPVPARSECPYRGLGAFDLQDAEEFFGREEEVAGGLDALLLRRLIVLTGPSGCGKSSLGRAGLAPALRALGMPVTIVTPGAGGVAAVRAAVDRASQGAVVVDQLEELFQPGFGDIDREEYARLVTDFATAGGSAVLTLRSDFLDRCAALPELGPRLNECVHFVRPMTADELRAAIEEPARLSNLQVEPGLTELVLRDVAGEPAALPHLSHALVETWARRKGSVLTVAGYQASGGISGAIAQSAEALYQGLDAEQRELCRSVLIRLVSLDPAGAPVRRRTQLAALREDPDLDTVVGRLAAARLVSVQQEWVLVAHESLATAWPRLRGWLEEDSAGARLLPALATAAEDWLTAGEPDDDLYRGARLHAALEWAERSRPDLTPAERRFLDASTAREQGEVAALAEQARVERRRNRRLRGLLAAALALLVFATVAGATALSAQRRSVADSDRATAARDDAEFATLVATSLALRSSQRDVAALLAAEAYRRRPDDARARNALMSTMTAAGGFLGTEYVAGATWVAGATAADGTVVLVRDDGHAGVYRTDPLREARALALAVPEDIDEDMPPFVKVTPSGDVAVVAHALSSARTQVTVLDAGTGRTTETLTLPLEVVHLAISPSGDDVAALGTDGTLVTVDLPHRTTTTLVDTAVTAVAYDVRSRLVMTDDRGRVRVAGRSLAVVPVSAVSGQLVVTGRTAITSGPLSVAAVDLRSGRTLWSRRFSDRQPDSCKYLAADARTRAVYCGDSYGRIQRRDLATGEVETSLDRQLGAVGQLAVSDRGSALTAVGGDVGGVSRWRLDGSGLVTRVVARGRVVADGFAVSNGQTLTAVRPRRITDWLDYSDFAVWDTDADRPASGRIEGQAFGWAAPGILLGIFADTQRVEYLDVVSGRRYLGSVLLPPDQTDIARPGVGGRHLYITHPDGSIDHVDPTTGRAIGPQLHVAGYPYAIAPDPTDERLAVSYYRDGGLHLAVLDTATARTVAEAPTEAEVVSYAPDGRLYGATSTGRIGRYDAETLTPDRTLPGARGWINSLQFSTDGSLLLATGNDASVTLYDVASGQRIGDPVTSQAPGIIPGFLEPDGTEMFVNVPTGVAVWDLDPQAQLDAACRIAGRQLTRAEWATHLGGLGSFRDTCPA